MDVSAHIQYFLGANAPSGFYSLYQHLLPQEQAKAIYILKGGPGCGKSTLMGQVAARLRAQGLEVEEILCSGDPSSLDAVVAPQVGAAVVDGTAPHVVEPQCPGAVELYVDLGAGFQLHGLRALRQPIAEAMAAYKGHYARAYRILRAAEQLQTDRRAALLDPQLQARLEKRAQGILRREVPRRKGAAPGQISLRFLGAVTHQGEMTLYSTALAQCPRAYQLIDSFGLAHPLLQVLLQQIQASGWDLVACPDPMSPDRLAHLLVPQLGLCFLSAKKAGQLPQKAHRTLRLDSAADPRLLRLHRSQLNFSKKLSRALMDEATACLQQAKQAHDHLETLYRPHVDFSLADRMAQHIGDEILSLR